jgi:RNA polymerase sigma factor (sigma-70 family)
VTLSLPIPWLALPRSTRPARAGLFAQAVRALSGVPRASSAAAHRAPARDAVLRRFEDQVLPHLDAAYTLARYLCRDRDAADDVVQTAFLKAYRAFAGFRGDNARAWLLAIVRNCHRDWRQDASRQPATVFEFAGADAQADSDGPDIASDDDDPESALLRQAEADMVRGVLAQLPEPMREILVLRDVEDCSYREMAQILDVPLGTVMSRLARSRMAFAKLWRNLERDGRPS